MELAHTPCPLESPILNYVISNIYDNDVSCDLNAQAALTEGINGEAGLVARAQPIAEAAASKLLEVRRSSRGMFTVQLF